MNCISIHFSKDPTVAYKGWGPSSQAMSHASILTGLVCHLLISLPHIQVIFNQYVYMYFCCFIWVSLLPNDWLWLQYAFMLVFYVTDVRRAQTYWYLLCVHIVASGPIVFLNVSVQIQLLRKRQMLCLWFVCKRCLFLFAIWLNFRQRNLLTQRIAFAFVQFLYL